ncbi:hypothetical protein CLAIMM_05568 [Cladophialophora immunda]|nr:hypothetical protein CLAIMM_05568 [Cladophialophora immunda]
MVAPAHGISLSLLQGHPFLVTSWSAEPQRSLLRCVAASFVELDSNRDISLIAFDSSRAVSRIDATFFLSTENPFASLEKWDCVICA